VSATETADPADLPLVRRAQAGDMDAFGELVDRNRRAVFRAALAAVGSATEADDVAQEAFVTAYRKLATFRGDSSFKTWLLAITWRKAIDRRKSVSRWVSRLAFAKPAGDFDEPPDLVDHLPAVGPSQEDALLTARQHEHVRRLISALPKKLRDPLLLACSGDHAYEEIATMLGIPLGTVKWRVSEARRVLKQKLAATGYARD
jgi:RNA polymerase sigma-70 factor (ECF subfamily)